MRTLTSIILVILTIPLFLIGILAASLKFQLLSPGFWETTFEKDNIYSSLTTIVKQSIVEQTVNQGGTPGEIKVLTDIITVPNVKDFVNRNLENILNYANGKVPSLIVYIPITKIPKSLLPKNFVNLSENMPLTELFTKLDIHGLMPAQIQYISILGRVSGYVLILDGFLIILFVFLLFVLTPRGKRFVGPGVAFLLNGLAALSLFFYVNQLRGGIENLLNQPDTAQKILGAVVFPLVFELIKVWLYAGIALVVAGISLLFIRKPSIE